MGSPIRLVEANLFTEDFEVRAISTSPNPPDYGEGMWMTHL